MQTCAAILNIFHLLPAASSKLIEPLVNLVLLGERTLLVEVRDFLSLFLVMGVSYLYVFRRFVSQLYLSVSAHGCIPTLSLIHI